MDETLRFAFLLACGLAAVALWSLLAITTAEAYTRRPRLSWGLLAATIASFLFGWSLLPRLIDIQDYDYIYEICYLSGISITEIWSLGKGIIYWRRQQLGAGYMAIAITLFCEMVLFWPAETRSGPRHRQQNIITARQLRRALLPGPRGISPLPSTAGQKKSVGNTEQDSGEPK